MEGLRGGDVNAYARAFPGVGADDLHQVWFATEDEPWNPISYPDFLDLVGLDGEMFSVTGFGSGSFAATVRRDQVAEVAFGQSVTGGFFSVLDIVNLALVGAPINPPDNSWYFYNTWEMGGNRRVTPNKLWGGGVTSL